MFFGNPDHTKIICLDDTFRCFSGNSSRLFKMRIRRQSVNFHRAGFLQDHINFLDVFLFKLDRNLLLENFLLQIVVQSSHLKSFL